VVVVGPAVVGGLAVVVVVGPAVVGGPSVVVVVGPAVVVGPSVVVGGGDVVPHSQMIRTSPGSLPDPLGTMSLQLGQYGASVVLAIG